MARRTLGIVLSASLTATLGMVALAPAASARVHAKTDPCGLITSAATGALTQPYRVERTDPLSPGNCLYYLQGTGSNEGSSDPVNLFVESKSDYKLSKALATKVKAVKGLGSSAYSGIVGGEPVVAFKGKSQSVRLAGGLDAATLIVLAKSFAKQVK